MSNIFPRMYAASKDFVYLSLKVLGILMAVYINHQTYVLERNDMALLQKYYACSTEQICNHLCYHT